MEAAANPLAGMWGDVTRSASLADVGPDLQPTGKVRRGRMCDDWVEERGTFEAYLAARGHAGLADTAGGRMQRKQVREMEKRLDAEGQDGRAVMDQVLKDPSSGAIVDAWRQEEDADFGCPGSLALLPNLCCLALMVGLLLFACFNAAYQSTPTLSDEQLEKAAISAYREKMAAGERAAEGALPEPEPELDLEPEAHTDAYIFLAASIGFFVLGVVALTSSSGSDNAPAPVSGSSPTPVYTAPAQPRAVPPQQVAQSRSQPAVMPAQSQQELERQKLDLMFAKKTGGARPQPQPEPEPEPAPGDIYAGEEDDFC